MKEKMKIFNLTQANLFIEKGCKVVCVGFGKNHKTYVAFEVNDLFNELLKRWHNHEFEIL